MGVVVLGRYTRIRWRRASPEMVADLEAPSATSLNALQLLDEAEEVWGIAPGQPVLFSGSNATSEVLVLPERPDVAQQLSLPQSGTWLIGVENSGSMWAALRGVDHMNALQLRITWRVLLLPGAGSLVMGRLGHEDEAFQLMAPPPRDGAFPARLDQDGVLVTNPFRPESGKDDDAPPVEADRLRHYLDGICHQVRPLYRYGVIADGVVHWLHLQPHVQRVTTTPTTALFRARLARGTVGAFARVDSARLTGTARASSRRSKRLGDSRVNRGRFAAIGSGPLSSPRVRSHRPCGVAGARATARATCFGNARGREGSLGAANGAAVRGQGGWRFGEAQFRGRRLGRRWSRRLCCRCTTLGSGGSQAPPRGFGAA